jgi:pyruvate kinase
VLAVLGDRVVILAGTPPGAAGSTNTIRVRRMGSRLR